MHERIIDMNFNNNKGYEQELDDNTLRKLVDHSNTIKSLWKAKIKFKRSMVFSNIVIFPMEKERTWRDWKYTRH